MSTPKRSITETASSIDLSPDALLARRKKVSDGGLPLVTPKSAVLAQHLEADSPLSRENKLLRDRVDLLTVETVSFKESKEKAEAKLSQFDNSLPTKKLDPVKVVHSKWANRLSDSFLTPKYKELKEEIEKAGGNVQPIKVRPILGSDKYEIVYGHRRHQACLELGIHVLAVIDDLSDAELFAEMDRENRSRADLRPYEQGVIYARALDEGLFSSMRKLADQLGVDLGNASKSIALARLPRDVIDCFSSPLDLQVQWGTSLVEAIKKDPDRVLSIAKELRSSNTKMSSRDVFLALTGTSTSEFAGRKIEAGSSSFLVKRSKSKLILELGLIPTAKQDELEKFISKLLAS